MPPAETDDGAAVPVAGFADGDCAAEPVRVASKIKAAPIPVTPPIAAFFNLITDLLTLPSPSDDGGLNALYDVAHEATAVPVGL